MIWLAMAELEEGVSPEDFVTGVGVGVGAGSLIVCVGSGAAELPEPVSRRSRLSAAFRSLADW